MTTRLQQLRDEAWELHGRLETLQQNIDDEEGFSASDPSTDLTIAISIVEDVHDALDNACEDADAARAAAEADEPAMVPIDEFDPNTGRRIEPRPQTVFGSNGDFTIAPDGTVSECNSTDEIYRRIVRFDLDEYEIAYPDEETQDFDILDLGYWLSDGTYEPASQDFRDEVRRSKACE